MLEIIFMKGGNQALWKLATTKLASNHEGEISQNQKKYKKI